MWQVKTIMMSKKKIKHNFSWRFGMQTSKANLDSLFSMVGIPNLYLYLYTFMLLVIKYVGKYFFFIQMAKCLLKNIINSGIFRREENNQKNQKL
jgi:ABC-type bacteriocin/lantibiotic exporter with double-glycine peptidase domain